MKHFTLMNEFKVVVICTLLMSPIQSVLAENIANLWHRCHLVAG